MGIEHDQLVNRVNEKLLDLNRRTILTNNVMAKKQRLEILIRRYVGGERTEALFAAMKKEIKDVQ